MESGSFRKLIYWLLPILMLFWDTFFHGIEYLIVVMVYEIPKEGQEWGRLGWFQLGYITLIMTIVPISLGYIYLGLLYKFKQYAKRITIIAVCVMFLFITIGDIYLFGLWGMIIYTTCRSFWWLIIYCGEWTRG